MVARKTERRVGQVIGRIVPGELLDTEAVMYCTGIGESTLVDLRAKGKLVAHKFNGRNWYRGEDLIALITTANG